MTRAEAEPLAQAFFAKYEGKIKEPTPGYRYTQVYDLNTKKIIDDDYLKIQDRVREDLAKAGLDVRPS
jgi:hypothetical protein